MWYTFVRDLFFGRIVYHVSKHKYFNYPEEQPGYQIPDKYLGKEYEPTKHDLVDRNEKAADDDTAANLLTLDGEKVEQSDEINGDWKKTPEGIIIVGWEGDDDPENPRNWPTLQKGVFTFFIAFLTMSVYMALAIYTPGVDEIMEDFHVGVVVATLPLTLFVLGYGIGPMVLLPLQENPYYGRTLIYIITLFLFFIMQIPCALVKNIAGLCICRFIAGFFALPALATGGASASDCMTLPYLPVGIAMWSIGSVGGPSIGPLIGSALVVAGRWRWTFWFMCILSGATCFFFFFLLPELFEPTLLHRKAERLRALTGNPNLKTEGELQREGMTFKEELIEVLWRPVEITMLEPMVLACNIYISLVYAIMYLWFEAFPIVFLEVFEFALVPMGCAYLSIIVGVLISAAAYSIIIYIQYTKPMLKGNYVPPESFMPLAIVGSLFMPVGIFIFGWTAAKDLHWIGPMIGAATFSVGLFLIFQTLFNYLGFSFDPKYLALVYASNDFARSYIAGVFPLFGRPLFNNLKTHRFRVGWGSSVLGFICLLMILIPVTFILAGPKIRSRSKYKAPW